MTKVTTLKLTENTLATILEDAAEPLVLLARHLGVDFSTLVETLKRTMVKAELRANADATASRIAKNTGIKKSEIAIHHRALQPDASDTQKRKVTALSIYQRIVDAWWRDGKKTIDVRGNEHTFQQLVRKHVGKHEKYLNHLSVLIDSGSIEDVRDQRRRRVKILRKTFEHEDEVHAKNLKAKAKQLNKLARKLFSEPPT